MPSMILTCSSLKEYVDAAQKEMNTEHPVTVIDRIYHAEPDKMKEVIRSEISNLPTSYDTILVSMGFCGGTWDHVSFDRRVVIPRVDDCISLLLHTDDEYRPNRKEPGHLYLYESDPEEFSALKIMEGSECESDLLRNVNQEDLYHYWFDQYHTMDIIDTGLNRCYEVDYVEKAQEHADKINADLGYVEGGYLLLKKLVSGKWDEQFIVAEPGTVIKHGDFFS